MLSHGRLYRITQLTVAFPGNQAVGPRSSRRKSSHERTGSPFTWEPGLCPPHRELGKLKLELQLQPLKPSEPTDPVENSLLVLDRQTGRDKD